MCDLQLAPLVERFGADHDAGRVHRGKQDAKNHAEGVHEVKRGKYDNGDDPDRDPDAGLALEELPGAGDPGPAVAGRHGMSFGDEIALRSGAYAGAIRLRRGVRIRAHDRPPLLATCPLILLLPWPSLSPPAHRPRS